MPVVGLRRQKPPETPPAENSALAEPLPAIVDPVMDQETWDSLTGREFMDHPQLIDQLAVMGEQLARNDNDSSWIHWNPQRQKVDINDGDIQAWTGTIQPQPENKDYRGVSLPFIKTRAIIPEASPESVANLLLDSNRVKVYNPWSVGRQDLWTSEDQLTKIVRNKTQPPMGSPLVATTLLHQRQLSNGDYLVVSRAVPSKDIVDMGISEILLGVNLMQPYQENGTLLTAITHVHSSAIPNMLALRLGVKSAKQFVQDLRKATAATNVDKEEAAVLTP